LSPLQALLEKVAELVSGWEDKLAKPAENAISERDAIRGEITRYKAEAGLA